MRTYTIASNTTTTFTVAWHGPTADTSGTAVVDGTGLDILTAALDRNEFSLIV